MSGPPAPGGTGSDASAIAGAVSRDSEVDDRVRSAGPTMLAESDWAAGAPGERPVTVTVHLPGSDDGNGTDAVTPGVMPV